MGAAAAGTAGRRGRSYSSSHPTSSRPARPQATSALCAAVGCLASPVFIPLPNLANGLITPQAAAAVQDVKPFAGGPASDSNFTHSKYILNIGLPQFPFIHLFFFKTRHSRACTE